MFVVFGIASLTPWNMFITAKDYFESKFRGSAYNIEHNFERFFQIGAICTDVIISLITVLLVQCVRIPILIYISNGIMLAGFIATTILAQMDSTSWPTEFFFVTEITFCLIAGSGAMYISAMWGITSAMSTIYTEAFLIGMTLAGILASVLNIITLSIPGVDFIAAGFWYFLSASFILILSLILFTKYQMTYYDVPKKEPANLSSELPLEDSKVSAGMRELTLKSLPFGYSTFCVLFVTFVMFPATLSGLESNTSSAVWSGKYFLPVSLFLTFNLGDLVGRFVARWRAFPGSKLIPWYTTGRFILVFLLLMCNVQDRAREPWFQHDAIPTFLVFIFAVTSGQVLTLALRYAPEVTTITTEKATIGTIMAFWGALGRVIGSLSTYIIVMILKI